MSLLSRFKFALLAIFPGVSLAASERGASGIGAFAQSVIGPLNMFMQSLNTISIIVGVAFLFTGIVKYVEYRKSPMMVTIGTVLFFFIAGLILIGLPFLHYFFDRFTTNVPTLVR